MSDSGGTNPDQPVAPEEPVIAPADAVVPPPPPEIPIPDGLLRPASEPAVAEVVIPPPPPEAMLPSSRSARRRSPILDDAPPAVAPDWSQPSVAPEVPTSGGYRVLSVVIFTFLLVVLAVAIAVVIYLATSTTLTFGVGDGAGVSEVVGAVLASPFGT